MADDQNNKTSPFNVPDEDEEALLNDLNLNENLGADSLAFQEGAPLPKKVELDIDDMLLDEEDEEEIEEVQEPKLPPPTAVEPQPKLPSPKPEKKKRSKFKLLLLLLTVLVPLLGIGGTLGYIFLKPPPPPPDELEPPPPPVIELKPFLVNFPGRKEDLVFEMAISMTFADDLAAKEFSDQMLVMRDLIFRFLLAQSSKSLGQNQAVEDLAPRLDRLVNAKLNKGGVKSLKILYIKEM